MSNDKAMRRIQRAKVSLMRSKEFIRWSGIISMGESRIDDRCPTAYTDGYNDAYSTRLIDMLNDKQLAFVVLHENMHKGARHLTTYRKLHQIDAKRANCACDYWINQCIVDADPNKRVVEIPTRDGKPFVLLDEQYKGMSVIEIFNALAQDQEGGSGGEGGEGFDEHDWDKGNDGSAEQKAKRMDEIERALRQGRMAEERMYGKGNGNADRAFNELMEPVVDWREELREFVKSVCAGKDNSSWRRINRRMLAHGYVLPSLISEQVEDMVMGLDMSGSTWIGNTMAAFFGEFKSVLEQVKPKRLHVIYWDCDVASHEVYENPTVETVINTTKPKGGGGTDPTCVIKHLADNKINPDCIIMLTDGEIGNWGSAWPSPVLWAISNSHAKITAPVGKTIKIGA